MAKVWNLLGAVVTGVIIIFILLASFEPPDSFIEKSWLGVLNRWVMDQGWEEEIVDGSYILSKTSLTDIDTAIAITCSLSRPALAIIFTGHSIEGMSDKLELSFDDGPYFNESWTVRKRKAIGHGGDMAFMLLNRALTSNMLRVAVTNRSDKQKYKFYLDDLHEYRQSLIKYCHLEG